ncbi:MAG: M20/M25/M40 family metallo-hydrolase [Spirochaetaceae bacterium]|nr:MAG: M20/M25/M40 family metallo-hydrolase [Spirochaetaceae bacterium]
MTKLIEIPSVSGKEQQILTYLEKRARELDLPVRRSAVSSSQWNLLIGNCSAPCLIFVAHVDTVEPAWERATAARVRGNSVWGLGAVDDKGGIVACLLALMLARKTGVHLEELPVAVGLTIDEEVNGTGSLALAKAFQPAYAIVLEGTDLGIAVAEAGHVDLRVVIRGKSVHTGRFEEGDSALLKAARFAGDLASHSFDSPIDPLIGRSAANVIAFHSGSAELNAIPDRAELYVVARLGRGISVQQVFSDICNIGERYGAEVDLVETGIPGQMECSEPLGISMDSRLVSALQKAIQGTTGRPAKILASPSWTDMHNLIEYGGSEAVVFGPGRLQDAHGKREHIDVRDILGCAEVFVGLLQQIHSEEFLIGET